MSVTSFSYGKNVRRPTIDEEGTFTMIDLKIKTVWYDQCAGMEL